MIEHSDRAELLADIADMYFLRGKTQDEIARYVGVTRSMVSRMINEARHKGIVEIKIHHPTTFDYEMQNRLIEMYGLQDAYVVRTQFSDNEHILQSIGRAGAYALKSRLASGQVIGVAWGSSIHSVVEELEVDHPIPVNVVQLVGALGSHDEQYDGHSVVQNLANKLGGEPYYLNAPFQVDSEEIVQSLLANPGVVETFNLSQRCDLALVGVGATEPQYSSYYQAGYLTLEEVELLFRIGATGGVCGIHFDRYGVIQAKDFQKRLVSISESTLKAIPIRIGVAAGPGKVLPILGALNGGFINILVTDSTTANEVLKSQAAG